MPTDLLSAETGTFAFIAGTSASPAVALRRGRSQRTQLGVDTSASSELKPLVDGAAEVELGLHLHPDSWGRGTPVEQLFVALG